MYTASQLKEMDVHLLILEVVEKILLGMFIMNLVWLLFIPLSAFTGANVFSIVFSLIAWRGAKVANSVADGLLNIHISVIAASLLYLNTEIFEREDENR